MNEYLFMVALVITMFLCAATWCVVKELFNRWVNNDWCKHNWGMWETKEENRAQIRFCKKCNKMERRLT
jgi:hypothetical protein